MKVKGPGLARSAVWGRKGRPIDGNAAGGIHREPVSVLGAWLTRDRTRDDLALRVVSIFNQLRVPREGNRVLSTKRLPSDDYLVGQLAAVLFDASHIDREMLEYTCRLVRDNLRWLIHQRSYRRTTYDALVLRLGKLEHRMQDPLSTEIASLRDHIIDMVQEAARKSANDEASRGHLPRLLTHRSVQKRPG